MGDARERSERVAQRVLDRVEAWTRQARAHLGPDVPAKPPAGPTGRPSPVPVPEGNVGRYGDHWSTVDAAPSAGTASAGDPEEFERSGRQDNEALAAHHDQGSSVLDLGCGAGRVALYMAPTCKELWAVDASSRMLGRAAGRLADHANVRYVLCHDTAIPDVPDRSIDLAYSLLVLQHLEREDAFLLLRELRRVIKPTGTVVVTVPNLMADHHFERFVRGAETNEQQHNPVRARAHTPQEVERLMLGAGFTADIDAGPELRCVGRPIEET